MDALVGSRAKSLALSGAQQSTCRPLQLAVEPTDLNGSNFMFNNGCYAPSVKRSKHRSLLMHCAAGPATLPLFVDKGAFVEWSAAELSKESKQAMHVQGTVCCRSTYVAPGTAYQYQLRVRLLPRGASETMCSLCHTSTNSVSKKADCTNFYSPTCLTSLAMLLRCYFNAPIPCSGVR